MVATAVCDVFTSVTLRFDDFALASTFVVPSYVAVTCAPTGTYRVVQVKVVFDVDDCTLVEEHGTVVPLTWKTTSFPLASPTVVPAEVVSVHAVEP